MRFGRMIAAGSMAMGAYRAYKQYKGGGQEARGGRRGRNTTRRSRHSSQRAGVFSSAFNRH